MTENIFGVLRSGEIVAHDEALEAIVTWDGNYTLLVWVAERDESGRQIQRFSSNLSNIHKVGISIRTEAVAHATWVLNQIHKGLL